MDTGKVSRLTRELLLAIDEDPEREGLHDTPRRVAQSYAFLTSGYRLDPEAIVKSAIFNDDCNHMIIVRDIELYSLCEHHMLPFFGRCHIGYISRGKVIGVSKMARIVDCFARRLQIQERLTRQIARIISEHLQPEGVGVVVEAHHLCMMMRGVEKQNSCMTTSAMLGSFHGSAATRNEFLQLIGRQLTTG